MKSKILPNSAGLLLGLLFVAASVPVLFKLVPIPEMPEGTPIAHFMAAFTSTGYMTFVKCLELAGGVLVAIPRTRNIGLLVLCPVIVNIVAFHIFITGPKDLLNPMLLGIVALTLYLLWVARKQIAGLLN